MTIQAGSRAGAQRPALSPRVESLAWGTAHRPLTGREGKGPHGRVLACARQHHLDGHSSPWADGGSVGVTCSTWKEQG